MIRGHPRVRARTRSVAAAGLVAVTLLAGCTSTTDPPGTSPSSSAGTTVPQDSVFRIGVSRPDPNRPGAGLDTLDPADVVPTNQTDMIAVDLLFDSLTSIDPTTNEAKPALAASVTASAALNQWTFVLREDARFSDGTAVTAADVKFTIERIARKGAASLAAVPLDLIAGYTEFTQGQSAGLAGVVVTDPRTVTITTNVAFASLPELLASPLYGIVPQAAVTAAQGEFAKKPVGSGSFGLTSSTDDLVVLTKSAGSAAKVDRVELRLFADRDAAFRAMRERTVDWAEVPARAMGTAEVTDVGTPQPGQRAPESFFAFNLGSPVYSLNPLFRQAIVKAVNRAALAKDVLHSTVPLNGVVPPNIAGGQPDACGVACAYDPAGAQALLAQAFPAGNVPTVYIDFYVGTTDDAKLQQALADQIFNYLTAVGIPALGRPKPFEEYRSFAVNGDRALFSYGAIGLAPDPDFFLSRLFASNSPDNVTGFKDVNVDAALGVARATADRAQRLAKYQEAERLIMATVPILPIAVLESQVVVGPAVRGYQSRFDGTFVVDALTISR